MDVLSICLLVLTFILCAGFLVEMIHQDVRARHCCSCGRRVKLATRVQWFRDWYCHRCYSHAIEIHKQSIASYQPVYNPRLKNNQPEQHRRRV